MSQEKPAALYQTHLEQVAKDISPLELQVEDVKKAFQLTKRYLRGRAEHYQKRQAALDLTSPQYQQEKQALDQEELADVMQSIDHLKVSWRQLIKNHLLAAQSDASPHHLASRYLNQLKNPKEPNKPLTAELNPGKPKLAEIKTTLDHSSKDRQNNWHELLTLTQQKDRMPYQLAQKYLLKFARNYYSKRQRAAPEEQLQLDDDFITEIARVKKHLKDEYSMDPNTYYSDNFGNHLVRLIARIKNQPTPQVAEKPKEEFSAAPSAIVEPDTTTKEKIVPKPKLEQNILPELVTEQDNVKEYYQLWPKKGLIIRVVKFDQSEQGKKLRVDDLLMLPPNKDGSANTDYILYSFTLTQAGDGKKTGIIKLATQVGDEKNEFTIQEASELVGIVEAIMSCNWDNLDFSLLYLASPLLRNNKLAVNFLIEYISSYKKPN